MTWKRIGNSVPDFGVKSVQFAELAETSSTSVSGGAATTTYLSSYFVVVTSVGESPPTKFVQDYEDSADRPATDTGLLVKTPDQTLVGAVIVYTSTYSVTRTSSLSRSIDPGPKPPPP